MPLDLARFERRPDLLVVTRSPLPLRLVLTVYSGFELTMVDSQGGRGVRTQVLGSDQRQEGYAEAATHVTAGRQVFVVFPVREGKDILSLNDAKRMAEALRSEAFPDAAIGVYSSAMSRDERQRVFDDFQHRRVDVLVCTTFIEDAPEVPNACTMMVEYADLHSIERLHRLRGHVNGAREGGRCYFIKSDEPNETMAANIGQLLSERDGVRLAELDLDGRDDARVASADQGQLPVFRWMNPKTSRQLVFRAREQAFQVLHKDPTLKSNSEVARMLNERWGDWMGEYVSVGSGPKKGAGRRRNRRRRRR